MPGEHVREREADALDEGPREEISNVIAVDDSERARRRIMGRYDAGESIIQPPESSRLTLGESIRLRLSKLR